jgi:hypothetical protein
MKSKLQVFISSTFLDLKIERQAAVEAILRSGHYPAGMELFTAGDKSQWEIIQRWITESDVYVLILGGRYGSIEPKSGMSYTELEYDFAVSSGKPFFSIVISDEGLDAKVKELGVAAIEKDKPDKLKEFRDKALSKMSTFFSDSKDIKLSVLESLPLLQAEYNLQGWIRAESTQDVQSIVEELTALHKENKALRVENTTLLQKIESQTKQKTKPKTEEEFDQIIDILTEKKIDITGIKSELGNGVELPDEIDSLNLAHSFRERLMRGVTNKYGIGEIESFVFFRLCPYLQTFELVANEKVASVQYRRYAITKKGIAFFAYIDKQEYKTKSNKKSSSEFKDNVSVKKSPKKKPINKLSNSDAVSSAGF